MDMEQVIRQLQETAKVMDSIPSRPAAVSMDPGERLELRRGFTPRQRRMIARQVRLMAEIQSLLDSLNRKPE